MMMPKVNLNGEKEDPVTELGLSLGYSTVFSRTAVRNDSSAGANAGSLSFVAANPVSELVWSPQGLTLKYADCSFVEGQSSRFLGVGPSKIVISTSQAEKVDHANIESTKGDLVTPEGKGPTNEANANKVAPDVGDSRSRDRNTNYGLLGHAETTSKPEEKTPLVVPGRNVGLQQDEPDPGDFNSHEKACGYSSKKQVMKVPLDASISPMDKDNAVDGGILSHWVENDQAGNPGVPLLEKLESMDENDVREPDSQIAGGTEMKCAASESSSEVKSESIHCTQNHLEKLIPPRNRSPENSRVLENHSADKGRASFNTDAENHSANKGRALFNTDADGRLLKGKNDSWESVESCNRSMEAKKRWRVDQPLFIGCKRAKHIHNQPSSSGFCGQNSSFVSWISNMTRVLSRPTIDAGAPLSFAFADPSDSLEDVAHTHMSEQNVRSTGFKSFFQKMYQPYQNAQEVGFPVTANEARIESSSGRGINKVCTTCADPTQRHEGTDGVRKQLLLLNKEFNQDASVVGSGPSSLPLGIQGNVSIYKGESGAYSGEDKVLVNKDALIISSSSPSEQKILKANSTEEKAPQFGCKGDFGTMWINRFSSKGPCSLLKLDGATRGADGATDGCPNSGRTLVQSPQSCGSEKNDVNAPSNEYRNESLSGTAGNKLPNCHVITESSVGFTRAGSYHDEHNVRKVDVMLPSKCLQSSEEIAPTFARRLDALKRNIPTKSNGDDKPNVPCCFCGMMGHQIRVCKKVAKSDLKGLLTAIHPHEASNMSPACIKCFQLNHWAVSCSHKQVQDSEQDGFGLWVRHGFSDTVSVQNERTLLKNCHVKGNGNSKRKVVSSSGTLTRAREDEDVSTATNQKDETEITAGCDFVAEKISEVPKGIFDLIKMLLLSRADILKWMNSGASLIHLDGYFLRLRLGKWWDGLGGSGYRVARISGMTQIDRLPATGKIFVYVNVGGVKCLVGSQYISNHDFLEDELKAWWGTTLKAGGKTPAKDDELRYKVEERRRLGI